jgi:CheY-like chemotaxis protein
VTGVDFYLDVATRWPGREVAVVLMTGGALSADHRAALGAAMPVVLAKPFDVASVERCLATLAVSASLG